MPDNRAYYIVYIVYVVRLLASILTFGVNDGCLDKRAHAGSYSLYLVRALLGSTHDALIIFGCQLDQPCCLP
jgi:hypothetical protein